MKSWRWTLFATLVTLWSTIAASQGQSPPSPLDGSLSVMTYNVKGAPWPVTHGRGRHLRAIGERLRALRAEGRNPHVVLLQEVFSADARAIARRAGYRYVVAGPAAGDRTASPLSDADLRFLAGRRFWHGERSGKLFGSGLLLLSDYPVTRVRRIAYPAFACAGLDCLANKGALFATIEIPGAPAPVDIVATHLNSRRSARVADARSLYAYERQVDLLSSFIQANRDPEHPLIVAGDFNVGRAAARAGALSARAAGWGNGAPVVEALRAVMAEGQARQQPPAADAEAAIRRNTDFEFVTTGRAAVLLPLTASVPFGLEPSGGMLSDHIGYAISFRLTPRPLGVAALGAVVRAVAIASAPAR